MAKFINVGHRGACAYARENTIASLEEGVARHADMLEFDVRRTGDGVLVLYHDSAVKTLTGRRKSISHIGLDELRQISRARGYDLATFEEALRHFGPTIPLNIEIKVGGFESDVIRLLHEYPPAHPATLSSFFPWVVRRLRNMDNHFSTALVLGEQRVGRLRVLARPVIEKLVTSLGISSLHLEESLVTEPVVRKLSQLGIAVFVWTVDDPDEMRRFLRMGVDGIITNKPDALYNVCLEMATVSDPVLRRVDNASGKFVYVR